jgi:hypothetical protein
MADLKSEDGARLATSGHAIPQAALALGVAGLVPFVAAAVQIATAWPLGPRMTGPALFHLGAYGACILSFMGGVQWGLTVASRAEGTDAARRYGASVLPALIAWAGLYMGAQSGLLLLALGFAVLLAYDLLAVSRQEAPLWYGRLRAGLTAVVLLALLIAITFGPF